MSLLYRLLSSATCVTTWPWILPHSDKEIQVREKEDHNDNGRVQYVIFYLLFLFVFLPREWPVRGGDSVRMNEIDTLLDLFELWLGTTIFHVVSD